MKKFAFIFAIIVVVVVSVLVKFVFAPSGRFEQTKKSVTIKHMMTISSPAFGNQKKLPAIYTCDGTNVNPPLQFGGIPEDAESLVLILDDPDAPGGTWTHWLVYNIAPTVREVHEDSIPDDGVEGLTSFRTAGYGGACPPNGTHRYFFKVYALDTMLSLESPDHVDSKTVEEAMQGHILDQAELIGLYR